MFMVKSRHSRKKKKSNNSLGNILKIIGALAILLALVGGGVYLYINTENDVPLNEVDLCPKEGARGTVAFLLDTTDELAPITKAEIKEKILSVQRSLPRFYRLSVYTLNEKGLTKKPVASICNPGRLDQRDELAQKGFTANPVLIERKYSEFKEKIRISVDNVFEQSFGGKQSPLLSTLQELSVFIPPPVELDEKLFPDNEIDEERFPPDKNIIIFVTDLLEHTDVFSIYRDGINFDEFQKSRATEKFGKSYRNVVIDLLVVRRNIDNFSSIELVEFWAKVFKQEFNSDIRSLKLLSGEI